MAIPTGATMAILFALFALAPTSAVGQAGSASPGIATALPPAIERYLRQGFGVEPNERNTLDPSRRAALLEWGPMLEAVGFQAPKRSYLQGLFAHPRLSYLTELLDRPELLTALPEFAALRSRLSSAPPVDRELLIALATLRRSRPLDASALRAVRQLQAEGDRLSFRDLDILGAAFDRPSLKQELASPAALRRGIGSGLAERRHVARETTRLSEGAGNLEVFSRVDLLRIKLIVDSLRSTGVRRRISTLIERSRDRSVEIGGVVLWNQGRIRWRDLPSDIRQAGRYRRPAAPRFSVELADFHLHATAGDDRPAAGPSLMDAFSAAFDGGPKLVITDLGAGRFDVDYYRDAHAMGKDKDVPGRLKTVALDLGVFTASQKDDALR